MNPIDLTRDQRIAIYEAKVQITLASKDLEFAKLNQLYKQNELEKLLLNMMAEAKLPPSEWSFDPSKNQFIPVSKEKNED